MDELDRERWLVLGTFGASLVAVVVGYLLAWRSKRPAYHKAGSLVTAAVTGFAGFVMTMWLIGAVMPLPPPDGPSIWGPLAALLVFSPLPLGAFYMCVKFARRTLQDDNKLNP